MEDSYIMRTDELIRKVEYIGKEHQNNRVCTGTGQTRISAMCNDILSALGKLKRYEDAEEATNNYLQSIDVPSENETEVEVEIKTDAFVVIKNEDILKYLTGTEQEQLAKMLHIIATCRLDAGKRPVNSYYVCNVDEPYANKVREVILHGEGDKLRENK